MIKILYSSNEDFVAGEVYMKSDFLNWVDSNDVPAGIIILIGKRMFLIVEVDGDIRLQRIKTVNDPISAMQFVQTRANGGPRMRPEDTRSIILKYISDYGHRNDEAPRNMDIAEDLSLIKTTVSWHIVELTRDGLIDEERYITDLGRRVAESLC